MSKRVPWKNGLFGDSLKKQIDRSKIFRTLSTLDVFVNNCLGLERFSDVQSGFDYNPELIYAAVANSYVETIGDKADSLHRRIKMGSIESICDAYLRTVEVLGSRIGLSNLDVILAFDYTDENFYGSLDNAWIYGWTGARGVSGKFKFITCALVCTSAPIRVPLFSIPVHIGHDMAGVVLYCLQHVQSLVGSIQLIIFDRGFYSKNLMIELSKHEHYFPYLIFVPKNSSVKKELAKMEKNEMKTLVYEFKLNRDKTTLRGKTTLAFLKKIFDNRSEKDYDWTFATNLEEIDLTNVIITYKKRWMIETMFRVQDEARIMSKSKNINIRFFNFIYSQVLQLLWAFLFKQEIGFKLFQIQLLEAAKERATKAEKKRINKAGSTAT